MSGVITLPLDQVAHTPCVWTRDGEIVEPPDDAEATSSDAKIAECVMDGESYELHTVPHAPRSVTLTVRSASLAISDVVTVKVVASSAIAEWQRRKRRRRQHRLFTAVRRIFPGSA